MVSNQIQFTLHIKRIHTFEPLMIRVEPVAQCLHFHITQNTPRDHEKFLDQSPHYHRVLVVCEAECPPSYPRWNLVVNIPGWE